jgi:hypothetical protein
MPKPCRLELNNSGAWKLLARFDAANADPTDEIMNAAEQLAKAINDPASGRTTHVSLRISTDDAHPDTIMRWTHERGMWFDAKTGDAA